jgi:hypothetical protein
MSTETNPSKFAYGCGSLCVELNSIAEQRRLKNCMNCGSTDRVLDALCFGCREFVAKHGTNP